jgi:putative ABC transport system permease protein
VLKIEGEEHSFKIVVSVGNTFASFIFANSAYLARLTNRVSEADALLVITEGHDAAAQEAGSAALQEHFERLGVEISSASTIESMRADTEVIFDALVALLIVMAILLALVGGMGLMGTMSINVLERRREIGVLRAIGASNRGVAQVFILEGAIGVMSLVFGRRWVAIDRPGLSQAIGRAIMGVRLSFSYSLPGLALWLVIMVLLSALASFIRQRSASPDRARGAGLLNRMPSGG